MFQIRWFRVFGSAAITVMFSLTLVAQGDTAAIQQRLSAQFRLTTTTADRSDIVTAGDIVEIQKPGLVMYAVASPMPPSNTYKNGKIGQGWGGFGKDLAISMSTPGGGTAADYPHRTFAVGEKCWVTGLQAQRDGVLFVLFSDPYDDVRYYGNLKIPYANKKEVPTADAAMQLVAEVLALVPQDNQGGGQAAEPAAVVAPTPAQDGPPPPLAGEYTAPGGSRILLLTDNTFTKFVAGGQGRGQYAVNGNDLMLTFTSTGFSQHFKIQNGNLLDVNTQQVWARTADAPAAPLPEIAAPPPPTDAPPPTVTVGQTKDQVTAAFGQPVKAAKIGAKEIFYYKDMKVTFINGKVSNVE